MNAKICRDCGNMLGPNARGCPRCAMNIEAETLIERFAWRFVLGLTIIVLAVLAIIYAWDN